MRIMDGQPVNSNNKVYQEDGRWVQLFSGHSRRTDMSSRNCGIMVGRKSETTYEDRGVLSLKPCQRLATPRMTGD